jgi:hypothetical protein
MQSALFKPKQQQVLLLILQFVGISQHELNAMLMPHLHPMIIKWTLICIRDEHGPFTLAKTEWFILVKHFILGA